MSKLLLVMRTWVGEDFDNRRQLARSVQPSMYSGNNRGPPACAHALRERQARFVQC